MALKFQCTHCQTEIIVQHLKPGETAKCHQCGAFVVVPGEAHLTEELPSWKKTPEASPAPTPTLQGEFGPKRMGEIVGECFRVYRNNFSALLALSAIFQTPLLILQCLQVFHLEKTAVAGIEDIWSYLATILIGALIYFVFYLVLYPFMVAGSVYVCAKYYAGLKYNIWQSLRVTLGKIGSLIGVVLVTSLATIIVAMTIIGIPVAIFLAVAWSFVLEIIFLERKSIFDAIKRSYELVRGNWWRVFGAYLLLGIIIMFIGIPCLIMGTIPWMIFFIVITPLGSAQGVILYFDLRARKEGYNREMLRKDLELLDIAEGESPAPAPNSGPAQTP